MQGFVGEDFRNKLDVENVIFKDKNVFLSDGFPHDELLGVFFPVDELKPMLKILKVSMGVCWGKVFAKRVTIAAHSLGLVDTKDFGTPHKFFNHELNAAFHMLMALNFSLCKFTNLLIIDYEVYLKVQILNYFHKIEN